MATTAATTATSSNNSGIFSDFCQAWMARFPGSELPTAWEDDVRANLKKHRTRVAFLREELEKEEMYVEYLDKLLADIERHRKQELRRDSSNSNNGHCEPEQAEVMTSLTTAENEDEENDDIASMNNENHRRSHTVENGALTIDEMERKRASLHLDIEAAKMAHGGSGDIKSDEINPFVTVISVSSPSAAAAAAASASAAVEKDKFQTFRKPPPDVPATTAAGHGGSLKVRRQPPATQPRLRIGSRESLNSVSSPTTPTSPMISSTEDFGMSPREGLGVINSSISSSNESCKDVEEDEVASEVLASRPKDPRRNDRASVIPAAFATAATTGSLDKGFKQRGRPDGREYEEDDTVLSGHIAAVNRSGSDVSSKANKVRELMANWESSRPAVLAPMAKPERRSRLGSGASSTTSGGGSGVKSRDLSPVVASPTRARMGSPSGKSHDSSDSETGWARRGSNADTSPSLSRRLPGETRLDRLVRRPSGEKSSAPPPLPPPNKPGKKPRAKPRQFYPAPGGQPEHLYDTVARDEPEEVQPEDEYYDNHLLYGGSTGRSLPPRSSDTIGSGGGSSADLGFDEPPLMTAQPLLKSATSGLSLTGSGTLSSSDTDGLSGSPSFGRENSTEDETNYVNIQYFLLRKDTTASAGVSGGSGGAGLVSDDELDADDDLDHHEVEPVALHNTSASIVASRTRKLPETPDATDAERLLMYKCILNSIVESEAIYLEGLSVMLQYMKAMKVTLTTTTPVIPKEEFDVIFYKIPDLHDLHLTFHENLKRQVERYNGTETIGHNFKMLASRMKVYAAFLNNYQRALESLHKCTAAYPQFADLTRSIKLRTVKGQKQGQSLSLEDLLHKPVARVQKHCLCLQDLIKYTPEDSPDFVALRESHQTAQNFVNEYNIRHAAADQSLMPSMDRPQQRHLVKNSFIVELSEGQRKLRHLFLFNDVLVSAKYKASGKTDKFTFQLKWYIPLNQLLIVEDPMNEPKENNPANLVALKTQTSSLRDQIYRIEKEEEFKYRRGSSQSSLTSASGNLTGSGGSFSKASEKFRKKLSELEAQLVLASPSLLFQVSHKQGKSFSFFLSSEYERAQWVETLQVLQAKLPANTNYSQASKPLSMYELQNWITSCRRFLKTNMGSFLMRSPRDEPLLVGDLIFKVHHLQGLTRPADLYVVVEVDSYGHYFKKSKTKMICNTMEPVWDEEFVVELEGSENLRILVYEQQPQSPTTVLRGRATLELSRSWLSNKLTEQRISMNDVVLTCSVKYEAFEETMRRVPTAKPSGLFGTPISIATKREKRAVPFIVTSCVREVERRGISEVGIYRVSGSAADVARLKKAYESNPYEAEQLLKECDIHSVAGILKLYLRDLPESLFTSVIYNKMFEAYTTISSHETDARKNAFLSLFSQIPHNPNQACIVFLVEHMVRVSQYEPQNKMSLHNLATVFGPTMLHSGDHHNAAKKGGKDQLTTGTVDVMAQAGILHFFLTRRARGEPIQLNERQV